MARHEVSDRAPTPLEMEFEGGEGVPLVAHARGDLDLAAASPFLHETLDALHAHETRDVILDLAQVGFVDSSGLRGVIRLHHEVRRRGGDVVVNTPSRPVRQLLTLAGLDEVMVIATSLDQARAALHDGGD
jgi:anti-sigma B factor antagonist